MHHVYILFKNLWRRLRHDACYFIPGNICTIRDYAEIIFSNFNLEIHSEYIGNGRSLSIEGWNIEIIDKELNGSCEFHSNFSGDSHEDSSTTHAFMVYVRGT